MDDKDVPLMFGLTLMAIRGALLRKGVLSQQDLDDQADRIFANIAIEKTVGHLVPGAASYDLAGVERCVRRLLHPPEPTER